MSNDTHYKIIVQGPAKRVTALVDYLREKDERWQAARRGPLSNLPFVAYVKTLKKLMRAAKIRKSADFVTWGYQPGKRRTSRGQTRLELTTQCDESNLRHITYQKAKLGRLFTSGEDGELACVQARFPELRIEATYSDEHGDGFCLAPDFEKEGTTYREEVE